MNAELLGVEAKMDELAESVTPYLESSFEEYGIKLIMFTISAMDIDDDELRRKYDEIGMEAIRKLRTAQADKNVMGILGDDWGRQQAANILSDLAANPGAGGVAAAGAGMGMGIGAGGAFSSMAQQMFTPITNINNQANPPYTSSSRFQQSDDTYKVVDEAQKQDPVTVLSNLKRMLDAGLIEQSEYDGKKREILKNGELVMRKVFLNSIIDLIFLAVFNIAFFLIIGVTTFTAIWIAYGFVHFAYLLLLLTPLFLKKKIDANLFGLSVLTISFVYFLIELLLNTILIFLGVIAILPILLSNIIITGIYLIILISSILATESITKNITKREIENGYIKEMSYVLESLIDRSDDKEVKKELTKAYDVVNSSPIKSNPAVSNLEIDIKNTINKIEEAVYMDDKKAIITLSKSIVTLMQKRNRIVQTKFY